MTTKKPAPISSDMAAKVAAALEGKQPVDTIADGPDGSTLTHVDGSTTTVPVPK